MKLLPIFLTKKATVEFPIVVYNCERIILNKLVCSTASLPDINSCTIYFNGTPVKYTRKVTAKKNIFFVDGIPNNIKSFHIMGPCHVQFMLDFPDPKNKETNYKDIRFSLDLSLEVNNSLRNIG